ncbi:MAG: helix-turn-helix transcriptional regulator [Clostridia bacterium]|nr:helix-turn-helix transcriptional regulator [Clostridia bacterium]
MKQSELAEATGINQRTISNYETGKTEPDAAALIKLADFFNVSIDYLVGRTYVDFYTDKKKNEIIDEIIEKLEDLKKFNN